MNYITLINNFWERQSVKPVSSGAVALFFALVNQANKRRWQFPVHLTNTFLQAELHTSKSSFLRYRGELCDNGYIIFHGINPIVGSAYHLLISDKKHSVRFETDGAASDTKPKTNPDTNHDTASGPDLVLSSYNNKTEKENINKDFKQKRFNKNNDKEIYDSGRYDFERIQRVARKRIREYLAEDN